MYATLSCNNDLQILVQPFYDIHVNSMKDFSNPCLIQVIVFLCMSHNLVQRCLVTYFLPLHPPLVHIN